MLPYQMLDDDPLAVEVPTPHHPTLTFLSYLGIPGRPIYPIAAECCTTGEHSLDNSPVACFIVCGRLNVTDMQPRRLTMPNVFWGLTRMATMA